MKSVTTGPGSTRPALLLGCVLTHVLLPSLWALEPNEILIIVNQDMVDSQRIGQFYRQHRGVPAENILPLKLGRSLSGWIGRNQYDTDVARPIRENLLARKRRVPIRCLLTTYGIPFKVRGRPPLSNRVDELAGLLKRHAQAKARSKSHGAEQNGTLLSIQSHIDLIQGKETNASVDSELSLVLFETYELYRWQPNELRTRLGHPDAKTLMVARLDGPTPQISMGLVEKALKAEEAGLQGKAYVDSRGIFNKGPFGLFDEALRDFAQWVEVDTPLTVQLEDSGRLFAAGECPDTALYCGWYRLKKYQDAFNFVAGAIGYHVASWEAADLRGASSSQWCPAMLRDGITATLGAVYEPYLHSFPEPKPFFRRLHQGRCLVEAYYLTKPFNSWQMVLIGDPLYRPFKKPWVGQK